MNVLREWSNDYKMTKEVNVFDKITSGEEIIVAVMGVGYVGLPLIKQLSHNLKVIGFDINKEKILDLDANNINNSIYFTFDEKELSKADIIIVCVPTPINEYKEPNLEYIKSACKIIATNMKNGISIIFESSYMPTCTEKICIPLIEELSHKQNNIDFFVGYSPERINPGDNKNTLNNMTKLIASSNEQVLDIMEYVYSQIDGIKLYRVNDIKIAELSKLMENCQRDINIAFMNEVDKLCHKLNIDIYDVISAAGTKWNFMKYYPGLVGGDCVGVNSYYLMNLANQFNEELEVLKKAREVNISMPDYIVREINRLVKEVKSNSNNRIIKVAIYGYTYKANIKDTRNTLVANLYELLIENNYDTIICDYNVLSNQEYITKENIDNNDIIILAVDHKNYSNWSKKQIEDKFNPNSDYKIFIDLKSLYKDTLIDSDIIYWNL